MSEETVRLYGVKVPAADYNLLKHLTNLLVGLTVPAENIDRARRRCVRAALDVVARIRRGL